MKQQSPSDYEYSQRKKKTRREEFLEIMDEIMPCYACDSLAQSDHKDNSVIQHERLTLASQLLEHPIVMQMYGVGPVLDPQLIAEIGDVLF